MSMAEIFNWYYFGFGAVIFVFVLWAEMHVKEKIMLSSIIIALIVCAIPVLREAYLLWWFVASGASLDFVIWEKKHEQS